MLYLPVLLYCFQALKGDKFVELFAKVGLQMNADKTVSMKSNPNIRRSSISEGAHKRRLRGEPVDYEARKSVLVECEKGEKTMQHRQLENHIQQS
jgi:hypothetical protein